MNAQAMCISNAIDRLLFNLNKTALMQDTKPHLPSLTTNFEVNKKDKEYGFNSLIFMLNKIVLEREKAHVCLLLYYLIFLGIKIMLL